MTSYAEAQVRLRSSLAPARDENASAGQWIDFLDQLQQSGPARLSIGQQIRFTALLTRLARQGHLLTSDEEVAGLITPILATSDEEAAQVRIQMRTWLARHEPTPPPL